MDDIVNSYLPLFPINSDLENISKKSFLFQFLFFLTNIYMKVANSTEIDFNPEVGFKYSNYSKYYNDMQNKELVLNDYNFLHKGEAQRNRWKVNLNFSYTKILKFTHSDSTRFYCVFFEYGSSGYDKEFAPLTRRTRLLRVVSPPSLSPTVFPCVCLQALSPVRLVRGEGRGVST